MLFLLVCFIFTTQYALSVIIDRPDSPTGWTEIARTDPKKTVSLTFALKNQNLAELDKLLLAVSTPGNPEYGNFPPVSVTQSMIAPKLSTIHNVLDWLLQTFSRDRIIHQTFTSDLLTIKTTIKVAEKLLHCTYYDYTPTANGISSKIGLVSRVRMGTDYDIPSSVKDDLYFVSPTHRFPSLSTLRKSIQSNNVSIGEQNPTTLRKLYNVGSASGSAKGNAQAIASFRNQYYDISDVKLMWTTYDITPITVTNKPTDEPSGTHLEAELDVQYMTSMGQHVPTEVWWTKGFNFPDALLQWTVDVLKAIDNGTSPWLFSVSYGGPESSYGGSYITKFNSQLALMGTAGVSVLVASGDSGAGGGCSVGSTFAPDYPASSAYVTAVGGVHGGTAGKTPLGETAWVDGGGGFSNYSPVQSWQTTAVSNYLKNAKNLPGSSKYNASGRGFPDIAAQSVDYLVFKDGNGVAVSGTSCSSPTSGGIFGLLNDLRLSKGMKPLGFLNPFIYQTAAKNVNAFNDCTDGYNAGCSGEKGFYAASGWDPATGNGSPNYEVLAKYVVETGEQTKRWVKK